MLKETRENKITRKVDGVVKEITTDYVVIEKETKDGIETTKLEFELLFADLLEKDVKLTLAQSDKTEEVVDE